MSRACSKPAFSNKQLQEATTVLVQWDRNTAQHVVACTMLPNQYRESWLYSYSTLWIAFHHTVRSVLLNSLAAAAGIF